MRDELHLMELVDRYLDGSMSASDRAAFEGRVTASTELQQLIEDQRALREGAHRAALRPAVQLAYRDFRPGGKWKSWSGGAAFVIIAAAGYHYWPRIVQLLPQEHLEQVVPDTIPDEAVPTEQPRTIQYHARRDTVVDTVYRVLRNGKWQVMDHRPTEAELFEDSSRGTEVQEEPSTYTEGALGPIDDRAVEVLPEFPGGMKALHRYLDEHIRHPDLSHPIEGMVNVRFMINERGKVEKATVSKGLNAAYDAEAVRVVMNMPAWTPAKAGGRPVASAMELPLRFRNPGTEEAPPGPSQH